MLNLKAYLPAYQISLAVSVEAMIETQLLGFRFSQNKEYSRTRLSKMIDTLILEHNRLAGKLQLTEKDKNIAQH